MSAVEPNLFEGLSTGPIDHRASQTINAIAQGTVIIGSAMTPWTIPSDEILPRAKHIGSVAQSLTFYGIAVSGDQRGFYPPTSITQSPNFFPEIIAATGQGIVVVTQGRCIARVTTFTNAINVGDPLTSNATSELILATSDTPIHARALQSIPQITEGGTVQYMAVDVSREGLLP